MPETYRVVIPIKLEFGASLGFIHKEFVTMHGPTILKYKGKFEMENDVKVWVVSRNFILVTQHTNYEAIKVLAESLL
jgi:hypothetical protein